MAAVDASRPRIKPTKVNASFRCAYCSKVFKRSEHCARHHLSHTKEKPFSCQYCHKSYARKDLVIRHERTLHANETLDDQSTEKNSETVDTSETANAPMSHTIHVRTPSASASDTASDGLQNGLPRVGDIENAIQDGSRTPTRSTSNRRSSTVQSPSMNRSAVSPTTRTSSSPRLLNQQRQFSNPMRSAFNMSPTAARPVATVPMENPPTDALDATEAHEGPNPTAHQQPIPPGPQAFGLNVEGLPSTLDIEPSVPVGLPGQNASFGNSQHTYASHQNKRVRMSVDESDLQVTTRTQNEIPYPLPIPETLLWDDMSGMEYSFPFASLDTAMGGVGDEFSFHNIPQLQAAPLDLSTSFLYSAADPAHAANFARPGPPTESVSSPSTDCNVDNFDRTRLPRILREKSQSHPRLQAGDDAFSHLCLDAQRRHGSEMVQLPLRNRRELQHFLNGYFDGFHRHLPIFHLPTFELAETPSPLTLAICAIGSLYRLDRTRAHKLFSLSNRLLQSEPSPDSTREEDRIDSPRSSNAGDLMPLWFMQTRVLLSLYATLGQDYALLRQEMDRMSSFVMDFRIRRARLSTTHNKAMRWHKWIEIESTRRYMCALFICNSLLVTVYDIPPFFSITQDLDFDLLDEERLWNAQTAEEWQSFRISEPETSPRTIRNVMGDMLAGPTDERQQERDYSVSGFTALVIIHAISMYARSLSHVTTSGPAAWTHLSRGARGELLVNAFASFARCREILALAKPEGIESVWDEPEGPILLNCEAILRVAYTRLFLHPVMPDSIIFLNNCPEEITRLLTRFVATPQERGNLITKAMASMCEAYSVPAKAGYLLVQKTAAISWSVEHAVAGWGCVILLSHWLHSIHKQHQKAPPNPEEAEIITQVKATLDTMNFDYDEDKSLAAAVVRSWAPLMSDVWVWGITVRMGGILKDLADIYDLEVEKSPSSGGNR